MNSITKNSSTNNKNIINNSNYSTHKSSSFSHRITSSISSSSSSSFSSYNSSLELEDFSLPNSPSNSSKIPFSWESIPGIPKTQILKKPDSCKKLPYSNKNLPLPPHVSTTSSSDNITCNKSFKQKKSYITRSNDPFFDALVECSKGGDEDDIIGGNSIWKGSVKSLSARFGLVNLSCKNSSSITHSLVFVPKVGPRRISYLKKRLV